MKFPIRSILGNVPDEVKGPLYRGGVKLLRSWYNSNFLNSIRRKGGPWIVRWEYKTGMKDKTPIKLHLGCGNHRFDGYVNVDLRKTRATDLVCDIKRLPYPDHSIEIIETCHVIEHLPRHDLPKALTEWNRVLISGGRLVIEYPDFDEIVKKYLEGDEKYLDGIFGLQRFQGDYHLFGYNFKSLRSALEKCGFTKIERKCPQDYHVKEWPCLRVECIKCKRDMSSPSRIEKQDGTFTGERVVEGSTPERIWLDHVARYEFASRYVKQKLVLDIACGTGYGSRELCLGAARRVVGVDISDEAIDYACMHYRNIEFRVGDISKIEFPDNSFDVITCFETIEHVEDHRVSLKELKRVLSLNGFLLISSPNRKVVSPGRSKTDSPANQYHIKEFDSREFVSTLSNYFVVEKVYGQRGNSKLFYLPFGVGRMFRKLRGPGPDTGKPELQRMSIFKEYRYVVAVCRNI